MPQLSLDARAHHLLKTLVERYIAEGHPVGSRQLARDAGLNLSAATVRNVMADLEEGGYLVAPHTSAGRVPTVQGYRFFVDTLLRVPPLAKESSRLLSVRLGAVAGSEQVLQVASELLSELTHMAGFVRVPRRAMSILRHVDFITLRDCQILAVLVTDKGEVENRIIRTERALSASEVTQAANYFNERFAGMPILDVTTSLHRELRRARSEMDRILRSAMELGREMLEMDLEGVLIEGEFNLLDLPDFAGSERLRALMDAFRRKRDLVHLLDESLRSEGIRIFIGEESGYAPFAQCSVVTAPYRVDGVVVGLLGVIGPTRMPYQQIIPLVDCTAQVLSAALSAP